MDVRNKDMVPFPPFGEKRTESWGRSPCQWGPRELEGFWPCLTGA